MVLCGSDFLSISALVTCWAWFNSVHCLSGENKPTFDKTQSLEENLDNITEVATRPEYCSLPFNDAYRLLSIHLDTSRFRETQQKVDLVSRFLQESEAFDNKRIMNAVLKNILETSRSIYTARVLLPLEEEGLEEPKYLMMFYRHGGRFRRRRRSTEHKEVLYTEKEVETEGPWWDIGDRRFNIITEPPSSSSNMTRAVAPVCRWSHPYYWCKWHRWLVTYSCPFVWDKQENSNRASSDQAYFALDFDVSHLDINQCDLKPEMNNNQQMYHQSPDNQIRVFLGTHKCDPYSSECIFHPGSGWTRGSYVCQCKKGFYSATGNPIFNGSQVETAYRSAKFTHSLIFVCRKCAIGCETCTDASPCLSDYNWPFRIALLVISMLCILFTLLLMGYIYHYRKLKVVKVASPIFLCVTLLGAVIMYLEMAAIFPVLDTYSCVATKWTRHLGFCITYSALLLKTWRVSLTYRVKSAHKIKLTDKQLLQWLFPILLVMVIYLSTWTVSSPPQGEYIKDFHELEFKQCSYNWWDHCLAIGEVLFLLWGIRVCYSVRNAESIFNEAKHISYAIYNIAIVNTIMVAIHLMIFPNAPPDIKYLFGFIRTQLSTTVTIIFVFGPKFYRVIKGQGDVYDNRARARGVTASFSLNGIGLMHEETTDLYQENEELKEEIQKLAGNIEFMKVVHMETINRHVKLKQGGYFSQSAINATHSPIPRAVYMKFESSDSPTSRISPAAELISERV